MGLEARLGWRRRKPNLYNSLYRFPKFGIGYLISSFGLVEELGYPMALYGFAEIPFRYPKGRWDWNYSMGLGLAFNFNPFDEEDNPLQTVIGSEINVFIAFSFEGRYHFTERWSGGFGIGYKHFSNGDFGKPNRGINIVPLTLMMEYRFHEKETTVRERIKDFQFRRFHMYNVFWGPGSKVYDDDPTNGRQVKSTVGINWLWQFHPKYRMGMGLDATYSQGGRDRVSGDASNFSKEWSFAVVGSWEWVVTERLYIPLGVGFYLHRNTENDEGQPFYFRAGVRTHLFKQKKFFLGIAFKAHGGAADFIEWTIGYTFKHDPNTYKVQ